MTELQIATIHTGVQFYLAQDFENYTILKAGERHAQSANSMLDQLTAWAAALKTVR